MQQAARADKELSAGIWRGPLHGIPYGLKDLFAVKGTKTTWGTTPYKDQVIDTDAYVYAQLQKAGAVLCAKLSLGSLAYDNRWFGGFTRNPWNPDKTPGGSSGGAVAAVASGMGPLAIGTDGGGSIRIPCSFTGLFGLKPTFGRVPAGPLAPVGSVAHVGPISRSVADAALMLNVIAQPDARDWHALPYDPRDWRMGLEQGVRDLRIAYSPDLGYAKVDSEVADLVKKAVSVFSDLGAKVEERSPGFENPEGMFRTQWFSGAAFLLSLLPKEKQKLVDPGLQEIAAEGEKITAHEILDLNLKRGALGAHMNVFHRDYDLLLTPTLAVPAFDAGREFPPGCKRWIDWTPFSFPFNLTGQPAASIPCGLTKAGLPVGLHIVGPRYQDALVLRAARAFETARPIVLPAL